MNKPVLPILAAAFILLMLVAAVVPVVAVTPTPTATNPLVNVVSIPEDDQVRQTGVMWFDPSAVWTWVTYGGQPASTTPPTGGAGELDQAFMMRADPWWGSSSSYIAPDNTLFASGKGPGLSVAELMALDPTGKFAAIDSIIFERKFSQYKLMVSYQDGLSGQNGYVGVPLTTLISAGSAFFMCDIYEKDKVEPKIPQGSYEIVKTSLTDVSSFFTCKLRASGEAGVYVVDLYYTGPQTSEYVADLIVMFKVELLPAATGLKVPAWGMDMQDLCMLAWPFADPFRLYESYTDWQKWPHLMPKPEHKWIWSSPDPLDGYSNCAEAAMFQRHLMGATIPIGV